tara:strand:+ start:579 stop:728 length:150 start_codon:yes stop_codon:yes gene_type:complete
LISIWTLSAVFVEIDADLSTLRRRIPRLRITAAAPKSRAPGLAAPLRSA